MRGKDPTVLHGNCLSAEREIYIDWEVTEVDQNWHLYFDVVEGKPFVLTSVEDWIWIQFQLMGTVLKGGGHV